MLNVDLGIFDDASVHCHGNNVRVGTIIVFILQSGRLRYRQVKEPAHGVC